MTRVPAELILPHVLEYMNECDMGIRALADKADVSEETIYKLMNERLVGLDFDDADALLCGTGKVWAWHEQPLLEVYLSIELMEVCACPGCTNRFKPELDSLGRFKHQIYCSMQCKNAAAKIRSGRNARRGDVRPGRCRNGHKRTPENTAIGAKGEPICRACRRDERQRRRLGVCRHGHDMTPENTYTPPGTRARKCRRCRVDAYERFLKKHGGRKQHPVVAA